MKKVFYLLLVCFLVLPGYSGSIILRRMYIEDYNENAHIYNGFNYRVEYRGKYITNCSLTGDGYLLIDREIADFTKELLIKVLKGEEEFTEFVVKGNEFMVEEGGVFIDIKINIKRKYRKNYDKLDSVWKSINRIEVRAVDYIRNEKLYDGYKYNISFDDRQLFDRPFYLNNGFANIPIGVIPYSINSSVKISIDFYDKRNKKLRRVRPVIIPWEKVKFYPSGDPGKSRIKVDLSLSQKKAKKLVQVNKKTLRLGSGLTVLGGFTYIIFSGVLNLTYRNKAYSSYSDYLTSTDQEAVGLTYDAYSGHMRKSVSFLNAGLWTGSSMCAAGFFFITGSLISRRIERRRIDGHDYTRMSFKLNTDGKTGDIAVVWGY